MFRQLNNKDCAVTVLAHALGIPYTHVVNAIPEFRYTRSRRRLLRERKNQIYGRHRSPPRRKGSVDRVITSSHLDYGTIVYDLMYRTSRFPYFSGMGLSAKDYELLLDEHEKGYVGEIYITDVNLLRKVRYALLAVPSLNFKNSDHAIIWKEGRIWDPSPFKRYDWNKLRMVPSMRVLAFTRNPMETVNTIAILKPTLLDNWKPLKEIKISYTGVWGYEASGLPDEREATFAASPIPMAGADAAPAVLSAPRYSV
jgi:hypothetical protein